MNNAAPTPSPVSTRHPPGLSTLFLTEMWERFSYYGMRALLVLFMVDAVEHGGLGLNDQIATAIYGLYTAAVYLAALPGGWIADRFLGARRAVWFGGLLIAIGQGVLTLSRGNVFYLGLAVVVVGTGLLKPNISTMVGELYPEGGARRDAGFTLFYMGINLGAALGPLASGYLGEKYDWHYGFAAAGAGMILGLIQYRLSAHRLGQAGLLAPHHVGATRDRWILAGGGVALVLAAGLTVSGMIPINPLAIARAATYVIVGVAVVYFVSAFLLFGLERSEKQRVAIIAVLFVSSALFWAGFEQAGSSFNLFGERFTQRVIGAFEIPAGWFQSLGPVFVIALAPVVASLWVRLALRGINPALTVKFAAGLVLLAAGFLVMAGAAGIVMSGHKAAPTWLISTYLLHSFGELCLSPVGLSSVTKLAPRRLVGQMMGVWFLATSLGNLIAGLLAGRVSSASAASSMATGFVVIAAAAMVASLALLLLTRPLRRMTERR